jgi:serine/threonine protein kinase
MNAAKPEGKSIFGQALVIESAEERAAYLEKACAGDATLRAEVEGLLAALEGAGDFLKHPAEAPVVTVDSEPGAIVGERGASAPGESPQAHTSSPETVGSHIGPYKLVQQLGEGGMGAVWVAEQAEPVKRRVALKLIKPGMDSAQVLRRFEAERQALALMDHTHIARVFDAGTTASGRPYFVMELVKGVPITKYCDELHLPIRDRLALFMPVCQAIQHAHQKGIIHRDIKPSNVLVCMQDGKPVAKVIDFGVAKALHQKLTEQSLYTEIGQIVGTLEYMSPEQAELSALDIDTRADVYALGVLLYELLTGTTPLDRKRLKSAAMLEMLRIIREEEPPRPSTRLTDSKESLPSLAAMRRTEPRQLTKVVRGELDWIVMKCLDKDRTRRYETASALARDVERYLQDEAVEACPPSSGYRLRKLARKHRRLLTTAAIFLLFLIVGVVVSSWLAVRARQAENLAEGRLKEVMAEQEKTKQALAAESRARKQTHAALDAMTDDVVEKLFARQPQLGENEKAFLRRVLGFYETFAADKSQKEEARFAAAEGQFRVAQVRAFLGETSAAMAGYRAAIPLLEKLAADFPTVSAYRQTLAGSYNNLGLLLYQQGKQAEGETAVRQSLAIREKLAADFPAVAAIRHDLARSHTLLGNVLIQQGRRPEAEKACRQALSIQQKLAADFPAVPAYRTALAESCLELGSLLASQGRAQQALAWFARAIVLLEANLEQDSRLARERLALHQAHARRAAVLQSLKRYAEALKDWERAIELSEGPNRMDARLQRAITRAHAGDHARAVAEADDLTRNPKTPGATLYNAACVYGVAMAAVQENAPLKEEYVGKALALLRRARTDGFFRDAGAIQHMQKDDNLTALHDRADFKQFIAELVKELPSTRKAAPARPMQR